MLKANLICIQLFFSSAPHHVSHKRLHNISKYNFFKYWPSQSFNLKSFQIVSKIFSYSAIHDDKAHNSNSERGQLTPKNDLPVIIIIIYFAQNHRTVKYVQEEKFQNIRIKVTRILTTRSWWQATVYRSLHPVTYTHINVCMNAQMDKLPKNIMPLKHCCNYIHTHTPV